MLRDPPALPRPDRDEQGPRAAAATGQHVRRADRVLLLSEGRVVVEGPAREALTETLTFSTQVNKLLGGTYLTPEDALGEPETRR